MGRWRLRRVCRGAFCIIIYCSWWHLPSKNNSEIENILHFLHLAAEGHRSMASKAVPRPWGTHCLRKLPESFLNDKILAKVHFSNMGMLTLEKTSKQSILPIWLPRPNHYARETCITILSTSWISSDNRWRRCPNNSVDLVSACGMSHR